MGGSFSDDGAVDRAAGMLRRMGKRGEYEALATRAGAAPAAPGVGSSDEEER